jgi:hypothetical protein
MKEVTNNKVKHEGGSRLLGQNRRDGTNNSKVKRKEKSKHQ